MKVLATGGGGQLALSIQETCPSWASLVTPTMEQLDITDGRAVSSAASEERPEVIINCAAYTAVDKAEEEADLAMAVNEGGAANVARAALEVGARVVQISTDYVFDGTKSSPWLPEDETSPLSAYGRSKRAGELAVLEIAGDSALVLRSSWLYSSHGRNFVKTMLRVMGEKEELDVVADQIGTPTWTRDLARAIWCLIERSVTGVHHWTDLGSTSWYEFATAIAEIGHEDGILDRMPRIEPIPTSDYPTPATRPLYSVLDKTSTWSVLREASCMPPRPWRDNLRMMLKEVSNG